MASFKKFKLLHLFLYIKLHNVLYLKYLRNGQYNGKATNYKIQSYKLQNGDYGPSKRNSLSEIQIENGGSEKQPVTMSTNPVNFFVIKKAVHQKQICFTEEEK